MVLKEIQSLKSIKIEENQLLSKYTYTKTGGPGDYVAFPKNEDEVQELLLWAKLKGMPITILGNASNLIVRDGGIRGLVVILTDMRRVEIQDEKVYAQSGAPLIEVSRLSAAHSLSGLEFACGIPGSIGGAVYMNAGAYGGEVVDVIESVQVLTRDNALVTYTNPECQFSYRNSIFQGTDDIILSVVFKLKRGSQNDIDDKITDLTYQRESKQPLEYPSCGSVFKRPEGHFTGKLIQDAGLQGYRMGGIEISKKHAGFMVNIDHGTATDYINLIQFVQDEIFKKFQVRLEPEVRIIGEESYH